MNCLLLSCRLVALATLLALLSTGAALAVAPSPELVDSLKAQGRWEWFLNLTNQARAVGVDAPVDPVARTMAHMAAGAKIIDYHIPCIMVDFSDNPGSGGAVASTPAMFDSLLFSTGRLNPTGSLKEYYAEVSYGQMNVIGTVVGWLRMPKLYSYYMNNASGLAPIGRAQELVGTAIDSAANHLDFSQFDNNGDGKVDGVMVIVAGVGAQESGDKTKIWPHRYHADSLRTRNGKTIYDYTIQPEETSEGGGTLLGVGVNCHEWGHILGLYDLYDLDTTSGDQSWALGAWSLMATGNYNGPRGETGRSPAHVDAWSRIFLGFVTPTIPTSNLTGVSIPQIETSPTIYKLWTNGVFPLNTQYFLVENREQTGFDTYLPGKGLLIYHVDPAMSSNRFQWLDTLGSCNLLHYMVALEQADGHYDLEHYTADDGDATDPYPYRSDSIGFDDLSRPRSHSYQCNSTQVAVWNMSVPGATMTANLDVAWSRPYLSTSGYVLSDPLPGGNANGVAEPGETFRIVDTLTSLWQATTNVDVTVRAPGSGLIFVDSVYHLTSIGSGVKVTNSADPFLVTVPVGYRSRVVTFQFDCSALAGAYHKIYTWSSEIGWPHELIVDDDRGGSRQIKLQGALTDLGEVYRTWDVAAKGIPPPAETLQTYPIVIWMTGDTNRVCPTHASVLAMKSYLDNHGHLYVTGQDIAENLAAGPDSSFLLNYFGIRFGGNEPYPLVPCFVNGVNGDPISGGLNLNGQAADGADNQRSDDILQLRPGSPAVLCYTYTFDTLTQYAASHIEQNGYRAVFFGFGFEAITSLASGGVFHSATRPQALSPILIWLDGDIPTGVFDGPGNDITGAGVPDKFELSQNYPNPFNAGTTIPFDLTGSHSRSVRLEVFDILGRQVRVLLNETLSPGPRQIAWDGTDRHGAPVASGVYFYRISVSGEGATAKRMVVIK